MQKILTLLGTCPSWGFFSSTTPFIWESPPGIYSCGKLFNKEHNDWHCLHVCIDFINIMPTLGQNRQLIVCKMKWCEWLQLTNGRRKILKEVITNIQLFKRQNLSNSWKKIEMPKKSREMERPLCFSHICHCCG